MLAIQADDEFDSPLVYNIRSFHSPAYGGCKFPMSLDSSKILESNGIK